MYDSLILVLKGKQSIHTISKNVCTTLLILVKFISFNIQRTKSTVNTISTQLIYRLLCSIDARIMGFSSYTMISQNTFSNTAIQSVMFTF